MSCALWEQYIIYLRKSRQDDPRETVEEVLAKHEAMLQEYALREFGHKIPEENIYREVVSGESIESREEMKKVLARIEDPNIKGVPSSVNDQISTRLPPARIPGRIRGSVIWKNLRQLEEPRFLAASCNAGSQLARAAARFKYNMG